MACEDAAESIAPQVYHMFGRCTKFRGGMVLSPVSHGSTFPPGARLGQVDQGRAESKHGLAPFTRAARINRGFRLKADPTPEASPPGQWQPLIGGLCPDSEA